MKPFSLTTAFYFETGPPRAAFSAPFSISWNLLQAKEESPMSLQFQFFGFDPDDELKKYANRSLDRLLNMSPYGSVPVALLEKTEEGFRCAIALYTQHGPLVSHACQITANQALKRVCEALYQNLGRWKERQTRLSAESDGLSVVESVA